MNVQKLLRMTSASAFRPDEFQFEGRKWVGRATTPDGCLILDSALA